MDKINFENYTDLLKYLGHSKWKFLLTVTFIGEHEFFETRDFKLKEMNKILEVLNKKFINQRWYKFPIEDYISAFGIFEWGANNVNPHYHLLLDVPQHKIIESEELEKALSNPKSTPRVESLNVQKINSSNRLPHYLTKESHWKNGGYFAFTSDSALKA